ncbi:MBL fold metallo-hydrolase [Xanthomonas campestris]
MRVHHLNCISTCPLGGHLMDGRTHGVLERGHLSCHCLLVETNAGLVLIDTGFGLRDVAEPRARLSAFFLALVKPDLREDMTAIGRSSGWASIRAMCGISCSRIWISTMLAGWMIFRMRACI